MLICEESKTIAVTWSIGDVMSVNTDLTEAEAWEVLKLVGRQHDATMGITWETLAAAAEQIGEVYR